MSYASIAQMAFTAIGGIMETEHLHDQAAAAREIATAQADRQRRQTERKLSTLRARYGAGGVQYAGSPLAVLSDTAAEGELDALNTIYEGELQRWKLRQVAAQKRFEMVGSVFTQALGASGGGLGGGGGGAGGGVTNATAAFGFN